MGPADPRPADPRRRRRAAIVVVAGTIAVAAAVFALTRYESYASVYDATYVGSTSCGTCHTIIHEQWARSPHARMVRRPTAESVVGDFDQATWAIPAEYRRPADDDTPAARMHREGDAYVMSLRTPGTDDYVPFQVDYVVGYQYRQVYLHREPGGIVRRLPVQWSVARGEFFTYWNLQEQSAPSVEDLWMQMRSQNSAWNLFCARCHVTHLDVIESTPDHMTARTEWSEEGIACEACHGPGSMHASYFSSNYVNRVAAFLNSKVRGEPVAYIATGPKMTKGRDMSVCARCHGPDIMMASTDAYRRYEPGYGRDGDDRRLNDLSPHFKEFPLQPGRRDPTVECWDDGRPKGIGMLFRSFIESACYASAEVRCYDCHDPHDNKQSPQPGLLWASPVSDAYCLRCHAHLADDIAAHTRHAPGTDGAFCYDCHMPHDLQNLVGGYEKFTRTHTMSSIPDPAASMRHGLDRAPNACNECHTDQTAAWAKTWMDTWWPSDEAPVTPIPGDGDP